MNNLIFVNASLTDGGSERAMTNIANYFAGLKYHVTMILVRNKKISYHVDESIEIVQLNNNYRKLILFFKRIIDLRKAIKKAEGSIVVTFMDDISFFTTIACVGLKKKVIVSIRNNPKRKDKKLDRFVGRFFNLPLASAVVFQTKQAKECYPDSIRKKSVVIPNPINECILLPVNEYNPDNRIVAVGRLVQQKRFDLLINAFYEIQKDYSETILEIYGEGPCRSQLQNTIDSLNLNEKIHLIGYSDKVIEQIQNARLYVSTSDFEGISNTMLEAMASGIPTICTDCPIGGASMVITNNDNGILTPVGNRSELVRAMREVLGNYELAHKLAQNGVKVRDKYSSARIGEMWKKLFDEVSGQRA